MKKEELQALSTEALTKKEASTKKANNVLIVVLGLLFVVSLFLCIKKRTFDPLIAVPLALSGIVFNNFNTLKAIREERSKR